MAWSAPLDLADALTENKIRYPVKRITAYIPPFPLRVDPLSDAD
jgi:hypothetical protein